MVRRTAAAAPFPEKKSFCTTHHNRRGRGANPTTASRVRQAWLCGGSSNNAGPMGKKKKRLTRGRVERPSLWTRPCWRLGATPNRRRYDSQALPLQPPSPLPCAGSVCHCEGRRRPRRPSLQRNGTHHHACQRRGGGKADFPPCPLSRGARSCSLLEGHSLRSCP